MKKIVFKMISAIFIATMVAVVVVPAFAQGRAVKSSKQVAQKVEYGTIVFINKKIVKVEEDASQSSAATAVAEGGASFAPPAIRGLIGPISKIFFSNSEKEMLQIGIMRANKETIVIYQEIPKENEQGFSVGQKVGIMTHPEDGSVDLVAL